LNFVLTRARWLAHAGQNEELAALLDAAEIEMLPRYLAEPNDATEAFRTSVVVIASHRDSLVAAI